MQQSPAMNGSRVRSRWQPQGLECLTEQSQPEAFLITCVDPVLDASLLKQFRSQPLVVWRSPGPVVPPYGAGRRDAEEAIEKAVVDLGVKEIAICGHLPGEPLRTLVSEEKCFDGAPDDPWLYYARATRRVVEEKYGPLPKDDLLPAIVEENVFVQMANLRTYPAVLTGLARGELRLHSWIYDAEKDELYGYGPTQSKLLSRIKRLSRPSQRLLPCLDPCDLYLA